jgi:hypothetical protein
VEVESFSSNGSPTGADFSADGYSQPSIATDGSNAWLVMIRDDGALVSRQRAAGGEWTGQDRVEIGAGRDLGWPNVVRQTDGRLRLIIDGPRCALHNKRNWVLAYQRQVSAAEADPALSVTNARVIEGDRGATKVRVKLSLSVASGATVTVSYATSRKTATAGADYADAAGIATFAPGDIGTKVAVRIYGDRIDEPKERLRVLLSDPSGATIADAAGRVTIVDDDRAATRTTVRVKRKRRRIRALGTLTPGRAGKRMVVKLARRRGGRYVTIAVRRPVLGPVSFRSSRYSARLPRPHKGRCKVTARYAGDSGHLASKARRTFHC